MGQGSTTLTGASGDSPRAGCLASSKTCSQFQAEVGVSKQLQNSCQACRQSCDVSLRSCTAVLRAVLGSLHLNQLCLHLHAATCRLGYYTAQSPRYTGNTVLCSGSKEKCLEPCHAGYDQLQDSSLCMQRCPVEAAGPGHLCPISRTCIRAAGVCPMLSDVPYICPVPDQLLGKCLASQPAEH
jgi:hypothetical protein